jgi:hypothetical protein
VGTRFAEFVSLAENKDSLIVVALDIDPNIKVLKLAEA